MEFINGRPGNIFSTRWGLDEVIPNVVLTFSLNTTLTPLLLSLPRHNPFLLRRHSSPVDGERDCRKVPESRDPSGLRDRWIQLGREKPHTDPILLPFPRDLQPLAHRGAMDRDVIRDSRQWTEVGERQDTLISIKREKCLLLRLRISNLIEWNHSQTRP